METEPMKGFFTLITLLLAVFEAAGQTVCSETVIGGGNSNSFDLRDVSHVATGELLTAMPRRANASDWDGEGDRILWIDRIYNMPDYLTRFHTTYGKMIGEVLKGEDNALSDPSLGVWDEYSEAYNLILNTYENSIDFTFAKGAADEVISQAAGDAVNEACMAEWREADTFMIYLCMCLTYDHPEGFWLDSYYRWADRWSYRWRYDRQAGTGTVTYTHHIKFVLQTPEFDHRRREFRDSEVLREAVGEYHTLVDGILDERPMSWWRYDVLDYFDTWLTNHNSYNSLYGHSDDVPTIAWSPLSALRGTTGTIGPVCEAYARAFKILCDRLEIPCVLATGFARGSRTERGESHMWNEVQMDNGQWYAVDVTWDDPIDSWDRALSGYENKGWFLLGSKDVVGTGLTFGQSHPVGLTWDINADYEQQWHYDALSFITDHRYDKTAGITATQQSAVRRHAVYNLNGQPVRQARHGLYIREGKKRMKK